MTAKPGDIDRLYALLPAYHRSRDADEGYPLRALLRVIGEQAAVVHGDIAQMYDDWFIETCAEWAIPYIGDLVGYTPVPAAGPLGDPATAEGRLRNRYLISRSEVANTVAMRRRKGTLSALAELGFDVAKWPTHTVEFFRRLGWTQNLDHLHLDRGRTVDVHDPEPLDRIDGAFDPLAHSIDVRRVDSARRCGRYNIPSIGTFVFRMQSYPVTHSPACCLDDIGPECFTFSVFGNDAPLYAKYDRSVAPPDEASLPLPIRRFALQKIVTPRPLATEASETYYGAGKSLAIYAPGWPTKNAAQPIPASHVIPADLGTWSYRPKTGTVAVDPVSGRMQFPPGKAPKNGVWVSYHYGFSADIGGGEYARVLHQPTLADIALMRPADFPLLTGFLAAFKQPGPVSTYLRTRLSARTLAMIDAWSDPQLPDAALPGALIEDINEAVLSDANFYDAERFANVSLDEEGQDLLAGLEAGTASTAALQRLNRLLLEAAYPGTIARAFALYRVGGDPYPRLADALAQWKKDQPRYGLIEFAESGVYTDQVAIELAAHQTLQIRAAERTRPVLRMLDYMSDRPDAFAISGEAGSRFVLDGVLVGGRGLQITAPERTDEAASGPDLCEVVIRHCTLVPGWSLDCDCEPQRPNEPSIELIDTRTKLVVEHSIIGSIEVTADPVASDPLEIDISDSIVDATRSGLVAVSATGAQYAFATLTVRRSTVLGTIRTHAVRLGENAIFMGCIHVARRQLGCIRFCYVTPNSRTPRRYHCQPDLVQAPIRADTTLSADARAAALETAALRVRPDFDSTRYGNPAYCRLAVDCAPEIFRGADDESEMGAFHDLFQPQREISLQTRLGEYTPAGMDAGIVLSI